MTLDPDTIPIARDRAKAAGLDLSHWVERAILREAARTDVDEIEAWEQHLSEDDQTTLTLFAELDRADITDHA